MTKKLGKTGGGRGTNGWGVKGAAKGRRLDGGGGRSLAKASAVAHTDDGKQNLVVNGGVRITDGTVWRVTSIGEDGGFYGKQILPKTSSPVEGWVHSDSVPGNLMSRLTATQLHREAISAGAFGENPGESDEHRDSFMESFEAMVWEQLAVYEASRVVEDGAHLPVDDSA